MWVPLLWAPLILFTFLVAIRSGEGPILISQLTLALFAAGVAGILALTLLRPRLRVLGYSLCLLAAVSLFVALGGQRPSSATASIFPDTPFLKTLSARGERAGGTAAMADWPLAGNGLSQVYSASQVRLRRHDAFVERTQVDPLLLRRASAPALLLTKEDVQGPFSGVRSQLHLEEVLASGAVLFRDSHIAPRARMVYAGERTDTFDASRLRSNGPVLIEGASLPASDDGNIAEARILSETPTTVKVSVQDTRPGVLVLADAWYPGWWAYVDGRKAEVLPVDGLFRGVELGEGTHEVTFRFEPSTYRYGLVISLTSLLLILGAMIQTWRRSRGQSETW
jgi:hypothetical protein